MSTEQEINRLATTLVNLFDGNCETNIVGHSQPDHLIVFQNDDKGNTHQLLLGITYINQLKDDEPEQGKAVSGLAEYISFDECEQALQHLTVCDDNGHCIYCGHKEETSNEPRESKADDEPEEDLGQHTRYVLLDETGEPAQNYHQDDSCDPIVGDDLECLISEAADWADLATDNFLEAMDSKDGEYAAYTIVREQVEVHKLTPEDHATLQRLKTEH